jgi:hypothetical protein
MWLQDVTGQVAMDVAKAMSLGSTPLTDAEVARSFEGLSASLIRRALGLLETFGLAKRVGPAWEYTGPSSVRSAQREHLAAFFGRELIGYPPFVTFATLLSQGYNPDEAARITRGVYGLGASTEVVRRVLGSWGRYSELLDEDGVNPIVVPLNPSELSVINKLLEATKDRLRANMFVAAELGPQLTAELVSSGGSPDDIARGIVEHARHPDEAIAGPAKALEQFLSSQQGNPAAPLSNLGPLADSLLSQGLILKTHKNLCYGVAGYRNASLHGPDPDTGQPWTLSADAALVGTLMALQALRSVYAYLGKAKAQSI